MGKKYLSIYLSIFLSVCLFVCLFIRPPSVCPSARPTVCLYLSYYVYLANCSALIDRYVFEIFFFSLYVS